MNMKRVSNSISERDRLKVEFGNAFNHLKISDAPEGIKISVPNDSRYVIVSLNNGIYEVVSPDYNSTYSNADDAKTEVLECLVSRELYANDFTLGQINYVLNSLINS